MSRLQHIQIGSEVQDPTHDPSEHPRRSSRACAYVPSSQTPSTKLQFARTWPGTILVGFRDSTAELASDVSPILNFAQILRAKTVLWDVWLQSCLAVSKPGDDNIIGRLSSFRQLLREEVLLTLESRTFLQSLVLNVRIGSFTIFLETQFAKVVAATQAAIDKRNGRILYGYLAHRAFSPDGRRSFLYHLNYGVAVLDTRLTERCASGLWDQANPGMFSKPTHTDPAPVPFGLTRNSSPPVREMEWFAFGGSTQGSYFIVWHAGSTTGHKASHSRSIAFTSQLAHPEGVCVYSTSSPKSANLLNQTAQHFWTLSTQVQYNPNDDLFFTSSEERIFGYRSSHNLECEFFELDHQDILCTSGGVAIPAGGSKLIAAFGSNVVVWKTE
ncbi:hypothetical protein B0H19DRAFT_1077264 [Mycena capillaripes]|nr:hypothetical protein B0H19DRAFT_1077264 [Mycena capillaripes]